MRLNFRELFERFRFRIAEALQTRVAWWAGSDTAPGEGSRVPWVAIIGREHYLESIERVPSTSWYQLRLAFKLRASEGAFQLFFIGPVEEGYRVVRCFRVLNNIPAFVSNAWFWLPETLALDHSLDGARVFDVDRLGSRYFLVPKKGSQMLGAMMASTEIFLLANGIPDRPTEKIQGRDVLLLALRGIPRIPASAWVNLIGPKKIQGLVTQLRPLAVILLFVVFSYMAVSTAYLVALNSFRDSQIQQLDDGVDLLLQKQRDIDRMSTEYQSLYRLVDGRVVTYSAWDYVKPIWDSGGLFSGLSVRPGAIVVRGSAKSATEVLEKIASMKSTKAAKFDSPVRDDMGRQSFSIMVTPYQSAKDGNL
jgi:hypothetical protein